MSGKTHYQAAEELLESVQRIERGAVAEQGILLEALVHAALAVVEAISLVPGAMP